ncbi:unnamed protein product [Pylaiella littoralis]
MHLLSVTLPMLFVGVALGQTCTNGLIGISNKEVCCVLECGQCGGSGCSTVVGFTGDQCCTANIEANGPLCSETDAAPCYMGDALPVLTPVETEEPVVVPGPVEASPCSNGLPGYGNKNICCVEGCGQCGGSGCSTVAGFTAEECCTASIEAGGVLCSDSGAAPCIIDEDTAVPAPAPVAETPLATMAPVAPPMAPPTMPETMAPMAPPTMPETMAPMAPPTMPETMAPVAPPMAPPTMPETMAPVAPPMAPPTMPETMAPMAAPTAAPTMPEPVAPPMAAPVAAPMDSEGMTFVCAGDAGVARGGFCCEASCGTCGGSGCGDRGNGKESCCTKSIEEAGKLCSDTMMAPCVMGDEMDMETSPMANFACMGDAGILRGDICCEASCGTCGGTGCAKRGNGAESCCTNKIEAAGKTCSETGMAPCIVDGAQYIGCYADVQSARIFELKIDSSDSMTVSTCMELCEDTEYMYYGVQWGRECWCGNAFDTYGESDSCDYDCEGDMTEICGGFDAMSVYVMTN